MTAQTTALPIVVGVTGHRDLRPQDEQPLFALVCGQLRELQRRYPDCPIVVLSSLAQGADRLCARAALELGCRLVAPLPMAAADYEQDFTPEGVEEFRQLLARADDSFVVPPEEESQPPHGSRGFLYRQAGIYIAAHSHILLALWDGQETLNPEGGGTWETIDFMLREDWHRPAGDGGSFWGAKGDGVVWHVATPRQNGDLPQQALKLRALTTAGERDMWPRALHETQRFNEDANANAGIIAAHGPAASAELIGDTPRENLPRHAQTLLGMFCAADALSLRFRDLRLRALRLLSGAGTLLVLLFLLYDELESDLMLPLYALLLVLAFVVYRRTKTKSYHDKYIHYRLLAEGLRVQFYWQVAGVDARVWEQYTWAQRGDLSWVKEALAALDIAPPDAKRPMPGGAALLRTRWVQGQLEYHASSVGRKGRRLRRNNGIAKGLLIASVGIFALVFILEFLFKDVLTAILPTQPIETALMMHAGQDITVRGVLKIVLGIVSAGTALLGNYFSKLSLPVQARDSAKMAELYTMAAERLDAAQNEAQALAVYRGLGREAVVENGNWMLDYLEQAPDIII